MRYRLQPEMFYPECSEQMQTKVLRIVISSPGDVKIERDAVDAVVADLNPILRSANVPYQFVVSRWERDAIPGLHPSGPQGRIDEALKIPDCDFLVGIFWKRFGTPVAGSGSGTEHEIIQAIASWETKRSPQLLLYFNESPLTAETPEEEAQFQKLQVFERELLSSKNPPLIKRYHGADQFRNVVFQHLLGIAFNLYQSADKNRLAPLRFAVTARPMHVRSEGETELVGDIFVKCTYAVGTPASGPLWFGLTVYLNTSVTSRLSGSPGMVAVSEALLIEVGRPGVSKVNYGVVFGNAVTFSQVELNDMQPGETRTFRITNIRCNAFVFCHGGVHGVPRILASACVGGQHVEPEQLDVGMVTTALSFTARSEEPRRSEHPGSADGKLLVYTPVVLTFKEEFANAFKPKSSMSSILFTEDTHGVVSLAESNAEGPQVRIPGSSYTAGEADHATRFVAHFSLHFSLYSPGIRLFVSAHNINPSFANLRAEIIQTGSGPIDASNRLTLGGIEMCEVLIKDGVASAEWELIERHPRKSVTLEFMSALAFEEHVGGQLIEYSYLVYGELGPTHPGSTGGWGAASSTLPVPRFMGSASAASLRIKVP